MASTFNVIKKSFLGFFYRKKLITETNVGQYLIIKLLIIKKYWRFYFRNRLVETAFFFLEKVINFDYYFSYNTFIINMKTRDPIFIYVKLV